MAISNVWSLPGQPPVGFANQVPLQGDGFFSPISMYLLQPTDIGDASGGGVTFTVTMDPRYISIVAMMGFAVTGGAASVEFRMSVSGRAGNGLIAAGDSKFTSIDTAQAEASFVPGPLVDVQTVNWVIENTDTLAYGCTATIYLFDRQAMNAVPLSVLFASLPSAGAVF